MTRQSPIQTTWAVCDDVERERKRQDEMVEAGKIPIDCTDPDVPFGDKMNVLLEELGEVARDVNEGRNPYGELVQSAAVIVAIAESVRE